MHRIMSFDTGWPCDTCGIGTSGVMRSSWGSVSHADFEHLKLPLFTSLVARRLGADLPPPQRLFGSEYKVVAPITAGAAATIPTLIVNQWSADRPAWTELADLFANEDLVLTMFIVGAISGTSWEA